MGYEFGQGYLFAEPLAPSGVASALGAQRDHDLARAESPPLPVGEIASNRS
jgi:hypothetical protein